MRLVSAFSLCLVFVAVCWSTPLPENTLAVEAATSSAAGSTGNQSNAVSGSVAGASASEISSAPCPSGETGKPDVQEFNEVLVLIRKPDLVEKMKRTYFVYQSTKTSKQPVPNTVLCTDRIVDCSCGAVKWEWSCGENGGFVNKMWSFIGDQLMFMQSNVQWLSEQFFVFKSVVVNVMSADKQSMTSTDSEQKDAIIAALSSPFCILGGDLETFVVTQTGTGQDAIVIVSVTEDWYMKEDKTELIVKINEVLGQHGIDCTQLITFTKPFEVDISQIKSVSLQTTNPDGSKIVETVTKAPDSSAAVVTTSSGSGSSATVGTVTTTSPPVVSASPPVQPGIGAVSFSVSLVPNGGGPVTASSTSQATATG